MTLRLSPEQARLRDQLADHLGIGPSDVMRMGLLRLARAENIETPTAPAEPEKKRRR